MAKRDRRHHRVPKGATKVNEYTAARTELAWTHKKIAQVLGVGRRTSYRYANGEPIPEPQRRLLRLLVLARFTLSERKFEEIIKQLQ